MGTGHPTYSDWECRVAADKQTEEKAAANALRLRMLQEVPDAPRPTSQARRFPVGSTFTMQSIELEGKSRNRPSITSVVLLNCKENVFDFFEGISPFSNTMHEKCR